MTDPKSEPNERAMFEAWMSNDGEYPEAVRRNGDGYMLMQTASAWNVWQARAALTPAPAQPEPSASLLRDVRLFLESLPRDLGRGSLNGMLVQLEYKVNAALNEAAQPEPLPSLDGWAENVVIRGATAHVTLTPPLPEPLPAGVEPVAWRMGATQGPGLHRLPSWQYFDDKPAQPVTTPGWVLMPLYTTPPTLTDAQCDAIRDEERERCASMLNIGRGDALLACGEMSAQEWRTVSAVLIWAQSRMRAAAAGGA